MSDNIKIVKPVPNWNSDGKVQDLEILNNVNYEDLDALNQSLIKIAITLNQLDNKVDEWEKRKAQYDVEYKRTFRDKVIHSEMSTESLKKLYAQAECEDLEMKIIYAGQIIGDLKRRTNTLRNQIDIIQTIGNNVRRMMAQ